MIKNNNIKVSDLLNRLILSLSAIVTICTLIWLLNYCRYGFDFTDEGFYLVWMSNPFNYSVSVTQFGFIYHPLYQLLNGNIAALRQANILITFALAWVLANVFLKIVFGNQSLERTPRIVISGAIATAAAAISIVHAGMWLSTPSYNSLALQALLVATIGLLLADKRSSRVSIAGWILIGIGGWLAFMAKPTTAAALGLLSALYLLMASKINVRLLAISLTVAVGLIVLSAFAIDGSIIAFIDRLKSGFETTQILGLGNHTFDQLLRLEDFPLKEISSRLLITGTAVIFSAAYFSQAKMKTLVYGGAILSIAFALVSLAIICGFNYEIPFSRKFPGLLLWSVPFASILAGFAIYRFKGLLQIRRPQWALSLTFLALPYVYAFGTGSNYWNPIAKTGVFYVLASFVFLSPIPLNRRLTALLLSLGLAIQVITVAIVHTGIESPYRQNQPLGTNNCKMEIGRPGSTLILSKEFGQYIKEAINVATLAGFKKGTPMIDLSGQSPGILYVLGASNIGQAWTIGGYPGSDKLAVGMLKRTSCEELSRAWLLIETEGPRKISPEILSSFGANLATDFEIVGTFKTAKGAGGHKKARVQQLLKPVRSIEDAMTACVVSRTPKQ